MMTPTTSLRNAILKIQKIKIIKPGNLIKGISILVKMKMIEKVSRR